MKMKSRLPFVAMVMMACTVASVLPTTTRRTTTSQAWTTGRPAVNLDGMMFTVSYTRGGITLYAPYYYPWSTTPSYPYWTTRPYSTPSYPYWTTRPYYYTTTRPWTTRPYYTTTTRPWTTRPYYTTTTRPWTTPTTTTPAPTTTTTTTTTRPWTTQPYTPPPTPPATTGVSVCLRYLTDFEQTTSPVLFTLSPSSQSPLTLRALASGWYRLSFSRYSYGNDMSLKPSMRFLPNVAPDMWSRVCVVVDSFKNVAQIFNGANMSIRKMLPLKYVWAREPVIDISGFDGQVTDVQVSDYPLRYREIVDYMNAGVYRQYQGSVLRWSYIGYSLRGDTLLEEVYEIQVKQQMSKRGRGRRLRGQTRSRRVFSVGESKDGEKQSL